MKKLFQRIKQSFSKLRNDMKDMTFLQKVDHLWTYYKEYAAVAIMSLVIILAVVISALTPPEPIVHSGTMVNVSLSLEGYDYLTDVFYEEALGSPEGKIALTDTMYTGTDTVDSVEESYQAYMGISAKVEAKELDYMLMDPTAMNYYGSDDILMDLRELLDPEELEQLHKDGKLIFAEVEDADTLPTEDPETFTVMGTQLLIPVAIDLSGLKFSEDGIQNDSAVYLVFIANTQKKEYCRKLWEHIKAWEGAGPLAA